ncbi:efflux RND transporter periplasmic adaptor subunit [Selenomonas ruminantium]|uniref:RND family efflux transporter, MFP subunit n=1 Tax=Selenomonas ruminantium TaxID=971 RepID=A0A1H3XDW9_SELRU|nr:efflux RND transporter periplasmic adaptor subunit [Selenomonas ruminantium]SDZ97605.1 RND family efflux transporter, MFP subunit [Selenomonas ruminantium]
MIMKKYFYIGIVVILMISLAIVAYGAWLNYSDENQIASRMDNRTLQLKAAKAEVREMQPIITMETVRFVSERMTDAVALTDGRILQWYVEKNSNVNKGQVLLSMANDQIPLKIQQATSAVSRAEAALAQANSSYRRQQRLMAKDATSHEKYEEAEARYLAAKEALREAESQRDQYLVQKNWLSVTSPVDGDVLLIYQREGAYVQAGTPVALVGNFDRLTFALTVADSSTRRMELGESFELKFPNRWSMGKAYDTEFGAGNQGWNQKVKATLREIVPPLSEPADVRRAVWEVDNRTHLLEPLTYTGVIMQAVNPYKCLTVPLSAMYDNARNAVFVVDGDGIIHLRSVVTGADDDKYIEIREGLSEGDIVLVGNFEGLEDGMKAEIVLEGENS